jgi:hypothetical protein
MYNSGWKTSLYCRIISKLAHEHDIKVWRLRFMGLAMNFQVPLEERIYGTAK